MWRRTLRTSTKPQPQGNRTTQAELAEAMQNGRRLAAQLRQAKLRRDALGETLSLKAEGALRETISSIRADLRSIADRAYLDVDVLICFLNEEERIRTSLRRKPTVEQLRKAIFRRIGETERDEIAAHEAATAAQGRAAQATADRTAARGAGLLLGISA